MKHCLIHWLIVVLSAFTATVSAQEATFVLEGDLSAFYASGNFVVWSPKPEPESGGAAVTMAAASTATSASTSTAAATSASTAAATSASGAGSTSSTESSLNVIARVPLGADGTFRVETAVDTPRDVYFYVLDAMGHEGQRYAPMKGNEFILEQGNLRLHMTRPGRFYIEGGPWMLDAWRGLAELTPDDPYVIDRLARAEVAEAKRVEERRRFAVGADIQDFVADTLDGDSVRLTDVRAHSRVVLVEFWASWCGPCRAEIPHMKEAYAKYGDQGFEILSFTVDEDRLDWEIASEDEDLPWLDTGMGMEHEAALAWGCDSGAEYRIHGDLGEIVQDGEVVLTQYTAAVSKREEFAAAIRDTQSPGRWTDRANHRSDRRAE